ncbi:MAG: hypothetical protein R2748_27590 [Bryobacterales bacterium]
MFTWVCQRCGKEVDVSEVECPHCAVGRGRTALGSAQGADRVAVVDEPYHDQPVREQPRLEQPSRRAPEERLPPAARSTLPPTPAPLPPPEHALAIRPLHLLLFGLVLLISLGGAIYLARPDLVSVEGVSMPKLPTIGGEAAPLQEGPLEVSGVRAWRDAESKLRVKAVLVNHSAGPAKGLDYHISLYSPKAEEDAPPAATFDVKLEEPLGARESREVEADLLAPEGLTALPEWNRLRVVVEPGQ